MWALKTPGNSSGMITLSPSTRSTWGPHRRARQRGAGRKPRGLRGSAGRWCRRRSPMAMSMCRRTGGLRVRVAAVKWRSPLCLRIYRKVPSGGDGRERCRHGRCACARCLSGIVTGVVPMRPNAAGLRSGRCRSTRYGPLHPDHSTRCGRGPIGFMDDRGYSRQRHHAAAAQRTADFRRQNRERRRLLDRNGVTATHIFRMSNLGNLPVDR